MICPPLSCSDLIFHHTFGKPLANTTFMQHVFSTGSVGLWLLHEAWDLFLEMVRGLVSAVSAIRSPVNRAVRFYNPWALWILGQSGNLCRGHLLVPQTVCRWEVHDIHVILAG